MLPWWRGFTGTVKKTGDNKYDVVARHHLVYDTGNVERFRHWAVLSIEKNRSGLTGVDMEFPKRFEQSRFETQGQLVREKLVMDARFQNETVAHDVNTVSIFDCRQPVSDSDRCSSFDLESDIR